MYRWENLAISGTQTFGSQNPPPPARCRAQKNKERKNGKESSWLLGAPVRKMILQMHTPARTSQCWSRQTPAWTRGVHLDAPGQRHGQQPRLWDSRPPGVGKQDKSSGASVDTTKTRSGPQRVGMSSGERPRGAANGKSSDTEALCQYPPPTPPLLRLIGVEGAGGGCWWRSAVCRRLHRRRGGGGAGSNRMAVRHRRAPQTKGTIVGNNAIYHRENLVRPFLVLPTTPPSNTDPPPRPDGLASSRGLGAWG